MKHDGDYLIFSSGNRIYAFGGVLGLGEDLIPTYGSDGHLYESGTLDQGDYFELADEMLLRWRAFREQYEYLA